MPDRLQQLHAYTLRLAGASFYEIAERLGVADYQGSHLVTSYCEARGLPVPPSKGKRQRARVETITEARTLEMLRAWGSTRREVRP